MCIRDSRDTCFNSVDASNLNTSSCATQCQLRFTLCAGLVNVTMEAEEGVSTASNCYTSDTGSAPPLINFDLSKSGSRFFPKQTMYPFSSLPFKIDSQNVSRFNVLAFVYIIQYKYIFVLPKLLRGPQR